MIWSVCGEMYIGYMQWIIIQTVGRYCSLGGEMLGTSLHTLQIILILTSDVFIITHFLFYYSTVNFNQKLCGFYKLRSGSDITNL